MVVAQHGTLVVVMMIGLIHKSRRWRTDGTMATTIATTTAAMVLLLAG